MRWFCLFTDHVSCILQVVYAHFESIYGDMSDLTEKVYQEVKAWQYQLKLEYVELAANVNLDSVARW